MTKHNEGDWTSYDPEWDKDYPDPRSKEEVSSIGTILVKGKFEGEMYYVPHFWNIVLDGGGDDVDDVDGTVYSVIGILPQDRKEFHFGSGDDELWLWESESGFVQAKVKSHKEGDQLRAAIIKSWEREMEEGGDE